MPLAYRQEAKRAIGITVSRAPGLGANEREPLGDLLHLAQYAADFEDDTDLMILVRLRGYYLYRGTPSSR
jgi:hypothetical protein